MAICLMVVGGEQITVMMAPVGYRYEYRVRYVDCDMQKVVYNAHYLTFVDDAMDCWLRSEFGDFESVGLDFMLKTATVTWHGSARRGDTVAIECSATRWGNTSFDVSFKGLVGSDHIFDSLVTYVSVDPVDHNKTPVPDALKSFLSQ
ncbi:MAG: acyl-CoA thioesterase [Acidimicrobiales bacterium]